MSYSASRLTIFAILSSIEEDLRNFLKSSFATIESLETFFWPDLLEVVRKRYTKEFGLGIEQALLSDLYVFVDFADSYTLINRNRSSLHETVVAELREFTPLLERLAPIRNRVAHIRPLHFDDLANTLDCVALLLTSRQFPWNVLRETMSRLKEDPGFVLGLDMPAAQLGKINQSHNLPLPDFDETGWVGRQRELEDVIKQCKGPYPVISILGEGGLGKTALALKAAYELLDDPSHPFDAVVWSTSKTTQLTASEIVRIENAITDSLGLLSAVAKELTGDTTTSDPIEDILYYLKEFRILVILDNLETVLDDRIRKFVQNMPTGSKLLITSRVGLGAYEFPYTIKPMGEREAVQLLRAAMKARGLEHILGNDSKDLASYCLRMHNSPGYIKWFVSAIAVGQRPEDILGTPSLFLEYCMSNVYGKLDPQAKNILAAMLAVPGNHSQAELAFISSCEIVRLQKNLQQLLATSFVSMSTEKQDNAVRTKYGIGDMAREYLLAHHQPDPLASQEFAKRKRRLVAEAEQWTGNDSAQRFSWNQLHIRSKDDLVTARFLREAMKAARDGDRGKAEEHIAMARKLSPDYFEVARVNATVRVAQNNLIAAKDSFEAAIELAPNHIPLRHWYAMFLFHEENDLDAARSQLLTGLSVEPDCIELQLELARTYLYQYSFVEAAKWISELQSAEIVKGKNLIRILDLGLQLEYRRADHASSAGDTPETLEHLTALLDAFYAIPEELRDTAMRELLQRAKGIAARIDNWNMGDSERILVSEIRRRLDDAVSGRERSGVVSDMAASLIVIKRGRVSKKLEKGFGFIVERGGEEIFFHKQNVNPRGAWAVLAPGSMVEYVTEQTSKGPAAVSVRPLKPSELLRPPIK